MMKLLVTGTRGQVSLALQQLCKDRLDIDLVAVGRPSFDLDKPGKIADQIQSQKPDLVVSAAAWTAVDQAEDEPDSAKRANADSAGEVARGAALAGAPIIHLSTDYVFDGSKVGAWKEDDPVNPLGVYGATKLEGERRVAAENPKHIILRTAWVYSPFGKNFVKTMLALSQTRDELTIVDDQYGCPTSAFDIAQGILSVADKVGEEPSNEISGIYHLAGTGTATWCDFARQTFSFAQVNQLPHANVLPVETSAFPTKAVRPQNSRLDCTKMEKIFGFRAKPWPEALKETIHALKAQAEDA